MVLKLLIALLCTFLSTSVVADGAGSHKRHPWNDTFAHQISVLNRMSLPDEWNSGSSWSTEEYAHWLHKSMMEPMANDVRNCTFGVFKSYQARNKISPRIEQDQIWADLNLLCGQQDRTHYVARVAFPTLTELGLVYSCLTLTQPTNNIELLQERQDIIRSLASDVPLLQKLRTSLTLFARKEYHPISYWWRDSMAGEYTYRMDMLFDKKHFDFLNTNADLITLRSYLNTSKTVINNTLTTFGGCVFLLYGLYHLTKHHDDDVEKYVQTHQGNGIRSLLFQIDSQQIKTLVALVSGSYMLYESYKGFDDQRQTMVLIDVIERLGRHLAHAMRAYERCAQLVAQTPTLAQHPELKGLVTSLQDAGVQRVCKLAHSKKFDDMKAPTDLCNMGTALTLLKQMDDIKPAIEPGFMALGALDLYSACATQINQEPPRWCFPTYIAAVEKPFVVAKNFWHPLIKGTPVPNNLTLGTDGVRPHSIITGPNAGGKSTTMKGLVIALLLAQSIGVSPATSLTFSPFKNLKTYLNISDDIGTGNSLFKAEVKRAQELLKMLQELSPGEFAFIIFDEVFSGTTPVEGCAAAYSLAKYLSRYDRCLCMIATHFALLSQLERETPTFANYKVSITCHPNGTFSYPFVLEPGIAHQHVAIDILRSEGFAGDIVDEAAYVAKHLQIVSSLPLADGKAILAAE